jgi:nicotinamide-nucleotide amidase
MNAEIIAVGSEMLTPDRVDTNSLFITSELNSLGVEVIVKSVIGDDRDRLADTVRRALTRAGIVVLSGGLGPTEDDVTRDSVAMALNRRQVFHPDISEGIEARFRAMGRSMPEINRRQAYILEGAEMLPNDRGTAPGQWIDDQGRYLMLLPGPPHELKSMFSKHCVPRLERRLPRQIIRTLIFRVTGMSESDLDQSISPIYKHYENPATTILAHAGDLQVHLRARCGSEGEAAALLNEVGAQIELKLADRIYSRTGETLEATVGELLRKQHATLAVAESVTGGGLAERVTQVPGCSDYFLGGFVVYNRKLKTSLLGIDEALINQFGPVSHEVAELMAAGARLKLGATYALAITGNAGPGTDGDEAPAGTVFVALSDASGTLVVHRQFMADRPRVKQFAGQMALDLLRRRLQKLQ